MSDIYTQTGANRSWATAGLVLGILSIVIMITSNFVLAMDLLGPDHIAIIAVSSFLALVITPITGLALCVTALVKAVKRPAVFGGKGMAMAGLAINCLMTLWVVLGLLLAVLFMISFQ